MYIFFKIVYDFPILLENSPFSTQPSVNMYIKMLLGDTAHAFDLKWYTVNLI